MPNDTQSFPQFSARAFRALLGTAHHPPQASFEGGSGPGQSLSFRGKTRKKAERPGKEAELPARSRRQCRFLGFLVPFEEKASFRRRESDGLPRK